MKKYHITPLLRDIDACFRDIKRYLDSRYAELNEHTYEKRYNKFETKLWGAYANLLFYTATGEPDYYDFYERLEVKHEGKHIGWDNGFIPDRISDIIWHGDNLREQLTEIKKLYDKGRALEEAYKGRMAGKRRKR